MTGGRIAVYGNVDRAAGILMEGGELAIFGSTGAGAGAFMKGGILRVQKKLFLHTIIRGGDIYQGDTQIVRDGIVIRRTNNK